MAHTRTFCTLLALVLSAALCRGASAAVPSDRIMSAASRGFVSIGDFRNLEQRWNSTQLGRLVKDEAMRPFVDDMRAQIERKLSGTRQKLGLTIEDLRDTAAGEVGVGLVEQKNTRAALAITIDVTGNEAAAQQLLAKIDQELTKRRATKANANSGGVPVTIYSIPPQTKDDIARVAVFFLNNGIMGASDNRGEVDAMIKRLNGQAADALASVAAYQETMQRCAAEAGPLAPDVRWYVEPFGYARATRSLMTGEQLANRGKDYVAILEGQGFDAIQGMGGFVNLAVQGAYDLIHRTSIYAPAIPNAEQKYELAMRIMEFPNAEEMPPQPWIPGKLASYRTFNMDLQNAYQHFGSLFDAIAGYEDAFRDVIEGLEKDPYGPQVQVEKDFIQHLGERVTLVTDYELPITTKSERFLITVELKDENAVAATLKKFMEADPNAKPRQLMGQTVWEIMPPEEAVPELEIGLDPIGEPAGDGGADAFHSTAMSTSAVCVRDRHLLIASHLSYLEQILAEKPQDQQLTGAEDYQNVQAALSRLIQGPVAVQTFRRSDETCRPSYELLRQGKMPEAETLLGRVLNRLLTPPEDEEEGILRKQKIDGKSLPAFESVRQYFSPAGVAVRSEQDGWFIVGATLTKQPPQAQAGAMPADNGPRLR